MRALIFAGSDGNFELLDKILEKESNSHIAICIGDLPIITQKTNIAKLWPRKFKEEGQKAKEYLEQHPSLNKLVYALAGSHDDTLADVESKTFNNVLPIKYYSVISMGVYKTEVMQCVEIPVTKTIGVGFLGGYYSPEMWGTFNSERVDGKYNRKSLALCEHDFSIFERQLLTYLFTYESPDTYDTIQYKMPCGFDRITELVRTTQPMIHFHSHSRANTDGYIHESLSIGVPPLKEGYLEGNLYTSEFVLKDINSNIIKEYKNNRK